MTSTLEPASLNDEPLMQQRHRKRGPERTSQVNMKDVARRAGVSVSTVSRVITGSTSVQENTRRLVLAAMDELDYVVNGLAQSMMGRGSRSIGFLVGSMVGPTFSELASGVEEEVSGRGDLLSIVNTHGHPEGERRALAQMREQRARAVLLVGAGETGAAFETRLAEYKEYLSVVGTRLVLCGRSPIPGSSVPSVSYDNTSGTHAATRHLINLGHRRILYLGAASNHSTAEERVLGYYQALDAAGLASDPDLVPDTTFEPDPCQSVLETLISNGPDFTAILAGRDEIAVRALRVLRSHGIRVPEDMSLVGFDDMPFMADLTPALTTVRVPYREIGRLTGQLLAEAAPEAQSNVVVPVELIIRGSTGPARQRPVAVPKS